MSEFCFKCGKPCNPDVYVWSKRKQRALPMCAKCHNGWAESDRMPR